jgi:hypothetical protein
MSSKFDDLAKRKSAQPLERIRSLELGKIRLDGGTQARMEMNQEAIEDYTEVLKHGGKLPDITVFFDAANYWLADGFHRYHAHEHAGLVTISCDIKEGTLREAILYAVSANDKHGLRRTNADKRRAVELLLNDTEWRSWSDREIGRRCGVDHKTVAAIRGELSGEIPQMGERTVARGTSVYKVKTKPRAKAEPQHKLLQSLKGVRTHAHGLGEAELRHIAPHLRETHEYLGTLLEKVKSSN